MEELKLDRIALGGACQVDDVKREIEPLLSREVFDPECGFGSRAVYSSPNGRQTPLCPKHLSWIKGIREGRVPPQVG
jgi:hypothetical protein